MGNGGGSSIDIKLGGPTLAKERDFWVNILMFDKKIFALSWRLWFLRRRKKKFNGVCWSFTIKLVNSKTLNCATNFEFWVLNILLIKLLLNKNYLIFNKNF